jgi:hypothetical protein
VRAYSSSGTDPGLIVRPSFEGELLRNEVMQTHDEVGGIG